MRVLLTGANGFVGAHVARQLLAAGHNVFAVVRPESNTERLHDIATQLQILSSDLSDTVRVHSLVAATQPDVCMHLAWYAEPGKYLQSPANVPALTASLDLLNALLTTSCERIVMVGTCAEYDPNQGWLHETSATRPETIYAAAKLSLAVLGEQLARAAGKQFVWARLFYLYGPYEDERRMVSALLRALITNTPFAASEGSQVRDYLHVEDVAAALVTLTAHARTGIYNIASGEPITVRRVMEVAECVIGTQGLVRFGALPSRAWDPPFICGDNRRLCELGWTPRYTLSEGLQHTAAWWRTRIAAHAAQFDGTHS